jgi:alpha-glucosidase (family GH31 glycosyl hydrolase)
MSANRTKSLIWLVLAATPILSGCSKTATPPAVDAGAPDAGDLDTPAEPPLYTPRWAFQPWISKDISDTDDTRAFVKGFRDRDIPVGVVVLDSPWETNYHTFVPNPVRYHDFSTMLTELHGQDIRLVLWMTQFVNLTSFDVETGGDVYPNASPNYYEGKRDNYYVNDDALYFWWKGQGGALDFFNRDARAWWHRQQDDLLQMGVDGWKLDFGDSYITDVPMKTAAGEVSLQQYSEAYYRDFLTYGVAKRGRGFSTLVRPYDRSYTFEGRYFATPQDAPVAWVGDNRRDYVGMVDALDEIFRSAAAGYQVLGSDVGGYLDRDDTNLTGPTIPFDTEVFARWTALGALSPFMQLHGRANITPWTVPDHVDETVALYRYWAKLHAALVPFFYSLARQGPAAHTTLVRPVAAQDAWAGDYRYQLGDALLVAPFLDGSGTRPVPLPAGARWYDWFQPGQAPLDGGQTVVVGPLPRAQFPLYVREGALLPLDVRDDSNGLGTAASAGALTVLAYPGQAPTAFTLEDEDDSKVTLQLSSTSAGAALQVSRRPQPLLVRFRMERGAASATADGAALAAVTDRASLDAAASGWFNEAATRSTWVKVPAGGAAALQLVATP